MQPLDVDIFGPFKNKFRQRLSFILSTKNNDLGLNQAQLYRNAVASALLDESPGTIHRRQTILSAFLKSGVFPRNLETVMTNPQFKLQEQSIRPVVSEQHETSLPRYGKITTFAFITHLEQIEESASSSDSDQQFNDSDDSPLD